MSEGMFITGSIVGTMQRRFKGMEAASKKAVKRTAFQLESTIVQHIMNQDLPWEALNEKYREWKKTHGLSDKIWIATSTAMNTVKAQAIPGHDDAWFIGWARNVVHPSGESMVNIAAVLEFGRNDGSIKPRPVVQPSVNEVKGFLKIAMAHELRKAFSL